MERNVIIFVLTVVCLSQSLGAPNTYSSFNVDKQNAQYGVVKLVSEVTILRMRVYLLIIEVNNTIKNMNVQLFQLMAQAGVTAARVTEVKRLFKAETNKVNAESFTSMDRALKLIEHLYQTNNHIVYEPEQLSNDVDLLTLSLDAHALALNSSQHQIVNSVDFLKKSVDKELVGLTNEHVTAIQTLMTQEETLLIAGKEKCDEDQDVIVMTSQLTKTELEDFVSLHINTTPAPVVT